MMMYVHATGIMMARAPRREIPSTANPSQPSTDVASVSGTPPNVSVIASVMTLSSWDRVTAFVNQGNAQISTAKETTSSP